MTKFAVVHNLDQLSVVERQQYLRNASIFLGLDPDLNGLDLIWLNNDDGMRRLTAYARRGTTDLLRDIHGITVLSLEQHDGPGYVSFKAMGMNKAGRQEIAVGASFLDGLKGDRLAAAVATAQTRALRRLTLQFVGLAVLDESEVNAPVNIPTNSEHASQAMPMPSVQPNAAPGKDVTMIAPSQDPKTQAQVATVIAVRDLQQEEFEARQAKLRADAIASLNVPAPFSSGDITPKPDPQTYSFPGQPGDPESGEKVTKKPRKPRGPNKPKVNLGPSEPVSVKTIVPEPQTPVHIQTSIFPSVISQPVMIPTAPPLDALAEHLKGSVTIAEIAARATAKPAKFRLTPDQVKPFRQRLFRVVNDHLEPNGFTPKEGMGNADKMRALATMMFPNITNMNELNEVQWEKYLSTLEQKIQNEGAVSTVKYVEESIGL